MRGDADDNADGEYATDSEVGERDADADDNDDDEANDYDDDDGDANDEDYGDDVGL